MELVAVLVKDENLPAPGLIDFAGENLAYFLGVLLVDIRLLNIHNATGKVLADVEYAATAEGLKLDLLGVLVADFIVIISAVFPYLLESHLGVRIDHLLDNLEILIYFAGSLVDIDNNVEVVR